MAENINFSMLSRPDCLCEDNGVQIITEDLRSYSMWSELTCRHQISAISELLFAPGFVFQEFPGGTNLAPVLLMDLYDFSKVILG